MSTPKPNDDDDRKVAPEAEATAYRPRRPRSIVALFSVMLLLSLLAIGGLVWALTSEREDPDAIHLPTYSAKSLAEMHPLPVEPDMTQEQAPEILPDATEDTTSIEETTMPTPALNNTDEQAEPEQMESSMQLDEEKAAPEEPAAVPEQKKLEEQSEKKMAPEPVIEKEEIKPQSQLQPVPDKIFPASARPKIAIIIDDMGLNRPQSRAVVALPGQLTLAYMPYAEQVEQQTKQARAQGHELIVHMPMEPDDMAHNNPGPDALLEKLPQAENVARLQRNLGKFDGYIGLNNHMGSALTADRNALLPIMQEVKKRGLWFLDSKTAPNSKAAQIAAELHIPYAERDVFLDNTQSVPAILAQLRALEKAANNRGYAIAIGHPHAQTVAALRQWLPTVKNFELVPLSAIIAARFPHEELPRYARRQCDGKTTISSVQDKKTSFVR